jgi:hypothetical protein
VFYLLSLVVQLAFGKSDHFADEAVAFTVARVIPTSANVIAR